MRLLHEGGLVAGVILDLFFGSLVAPLEVRVESTEWRVTCSPRLAHRDWLSVQNLELE